MKQSLIALALLPLLYAASPSHAQLILSDVFDNGPAGAAPTGPLVGSATYGSGILQGSTIGQYTVRDIAVRRQLEVTPTGTPGMADNGTLIEYNPLASAQTGRALYYDFTVLPGGDSQGVNGWVQQITLDPLGTNLALAWSGTSFGRELVLMKSSPGGGTFDLQFLGVHYTPGTRYTVDWNFDTATDFYSLALNGSPLITNASLGTDAHGMFQLTFASNFTTTGSALIDNVGIQAVPEPSVWAMWLGGAFALCRALRASRQARMSR